MNIRKRLIAVILALVLCVSLFPVGTALAGTDEERTLTRTEMISKLPSERPEVHIPENIDQAWYWGDGEWVLGKSKETVFREIIKQVERLTGGSKSETQKARAIFNWVAGNISYDYTAYQYYLSVDRGGSLTAAQKARYYQSADAFYVFHQRRGICSGYSSLANLMLTLAGLPVAAIVGEAREGGPHAWSAVYADSRWILFDATWNEWNMSPTYHKSIDQINLLNGVLRITIYNDGEVLCMVLKGHDCPSDLIIPEGVNSFWFGDDDCTTLTSVVIPNSATEISVISFKGCTNLTSVTIPNSVVSIGSSAFEGCTSLTSVIIPDSVTSIGSSAFEGCTSLTSVTIPNSVTEIDSKAFEGCTSLTSVTILGSVTSIGWKAFEGCTNLTDVTISENLTEIGEDAFGDTPWMKNQGAFFIVNDILLKYQGDGGSVTIPNGVTKIDCGAFASCTNLTGVTIPDSVTEIKTEAFYNCTNLTSVIIPNSVTEIGKKAFRSTGLVSVTIPDSVTKIGDGAFSSCYNLCSVTIPKSVTEIGADAFSWCGSLTSVTIPDSVTSIGDWAFDGCTSLTSVTIPDSVTSIGNRAFDSCSSLTSVTIPDSVTSIGNRAFGWCDSLTSVIIPDSVIEIGEEAFKWCQGLTDIVIPSSVTSIGEGVFYGCTGLTTIQVDTNNQNYISVDGVLFTRDVKTLLAYPGGRTGAYDIPSGVTETGSKAFACSNLTSVTIPTSMTEIGNEAFSDSDLTSVTIPNSVTIIGKGMFDSCTDLTSIVIPESVTRIEDNAFLNCIGLTSVTIPSSVTSIGDYTFYWCSSLSKVAIPSSVTSIGDDAFYGCESLKDVYYGGTAAQWAAVSIGDNNDYLTGATIHYNSPMPKPAEPEKPVAHPNTQTVTIDGKKVEFQIYSIKDEKGNDTSYIKIRDLALALKGTAAQFDVGQVNGVITFTSGGEYKPTGTENSTPYSGKQTYTKNSGEVSVNGTKYPIDAFQITHNGAGYTYFQLRDIAQKLNFNIAWRGGAVIETDKPYTGK